MSSISGEKKLFRYCKIYEQIYENPFITLHQISKNTGISKHAVTQHLSEMYSSILYGPMIFLKPAQNYHHYAYFLTVENPVVTYEQFTEIPHVIFKSSNAGNWDLLVISEKLIDLSAVESVKECIHYGIKGVTHLSKVTCLDWATSMEKMYNAMGNPEKKSLLYEEIPDLPWHKNDWTLYHKFRDNIRIQAASVLRESGIHYKQYQKWISQLLKVSNVQPAFYLHGFNKYFALDFLFKSCYQEQLIHILGQLPSTSSFFSVGDRLLARLYLLDSKEKDDLFSLVFQLGEKGYFTELHQAMVVFTDSDISGKGFSMY